MRTEMQQIVRPPQNVPGREAEGSPQAQAPAAHALDDAWELHSRKARVVRWTARAP